MVYQTIVEVSGETIVLLIELVVDLMNIDVKGDKVVLVVEFD